MRITILVALLAVFCAAAHAVAAPLPQSTSGDASAPATANAERVELNTADRAALESLPGVGPRTAERIIEYRDDNGGFKKIEDLMNVRGIGERTFLRLRDLVRIDAAEGQQ